VNEDLADETERNQDFLYRVPLAFPERVVSTALKFSNFAFCPCILDAALLGCSHLNNNKVPVVFSLSLIIQFYHA
jgi:hypothetical protein